jgi:hypothetical protein
VTHEASEGNRLIFNVACLKPFNNDALMTLTADQLGSDELSDLPRKHNQFSLKFKKKTQIPDTLVFRGASVDDTFDVPATGYPESEDDSYYAEFEHAVISITDHSFDGMNCYIDQTVWQSNFEESGVNYGTLKDPYKFKLRFMPYDDFGGTIYDLRLYGNAIKEDETTETLDVSGTDYAKEKEYQNDLVSTDLNWHKFFLAWVTSKSTQERKITVVDPNENFVSLMTLMYGTSVNQDNRVISIDGVKMTVESATWAMTKERWELSGRQTRTSTTFTEYVEKQKANNIFDDMQKKLIVAFDVAHPNADTPDEVTQQIDIPTEKNINNYTVEIDPVYMKGTTNTAKYVAFNFQRRQFEFEAYAGLPPENVTDIGYTLDDSVLADNVFGSYSRLFYPNPADVTVDAENGRQLGSFNVKFYRKSDSAFVGEYYDVLDGYWPAMYLAFMIKRNLNYGYTYAKVKGYSPGYNPSEGPYIVIAPEDIYYASQLYAVLDKVQIEADSFEPLQGTFRFKIFQDINQRKNDGILGSAPSRTSIGGSTPMTFSISTVPDSFNPAFEETEYVVYETYTQVEFKNASGVTVKRVIIRNSTESGYIEGVAYRYTTYDDYKYFAYKYQNGTRKTIDCYDP